MSDAPHTLLELDAFIEAAGLPVSTETLTEVWDRTRAPGGALPAGQVLLLVIMPVKPGQALRFEEAAIRFVQATRGLGSTLHHALDDETTWFLVERFGDRAAFERHMAADYFREFQIEQQPLLAGTVEAIFLEPRS